MRNYAKCNICHDELQIKEWERCAHCDNLFCEDCIPKHKQFVKYDTSPTVKTENTAFLTGLFP